MADLIGFIFDTAMWLALTIGSALVIVIIVQQNSGREQRRLLVFIAALAFEYFLIGLFFIGVVSSLTTGRVASAFAQLLALIVAGFLTKPLWGLAALVADGIARTDQSPQLPAAPPPPPPAAKQPTPEVAPPAAERPLPKPLPVELMVTTALDTSSSIENWWDAWGNTRTTNARIAALGNAERLALATARAADAEAKGIDAFMRRADRLTELHMRQALEEVFRIERLSVAEQNLLVAQSRREKERHEVKREELEAKHSLEAKREFKKIKFDIGLARANARKNDAEVDGKTAEAAVVKIAGELARLSRRKNPNVMDWLDQHIALLETAIEEAGADAIDTRDKRAELSMLRRLKATGGNEGA